MAHRSRRWESALTIAGILIVGVPVAFNPAGFDQYQLPKLFVAGLASVVGLTAVAVLYGLIWHRALVPLGSLLLVLTASALLSDAVGVALVGTSSRRFGVAGWLLLFAAFMIGMGLARTGRRVVLLRALWISSIFVSAYVVAQRLGVDPFGEVDGPAFRPGSTFGSATFCGGYLAFVVAATASALFSRPEQWRWLSPILLLNGTALLLTQSRGAWIGATVGALLGAIVEWRRTHDARVLVLSATAVAAAGLIVFTVPGLLTRASTLTEPTEGTAGGRIELAQMGIRAVAELPILGWGPDLSRPAMHQQIAEDFERSFSDDRIEDRAHNVIIDVAIWSGLLGALLFMWFIVEVGRSGWSLRADWTALATLAGLLAFGVHLLFNFPTPELDVVAWLFAGTLVPVASHVRARPPSYVAGMAAVIIASVILVASLDAVSSDRHLRQAVDAENDGDVVAAAAGYENAVAASPRSTRFLEVQARWFLRSGRPVDAVDTARRAVDADPSDPYLVELLAKSLSTTALSSGDLAASREAESLLRGLLNDSPNDGSLHLELGTALAAQGRLDEAQDEFRAAAIILPERSEPLRNLGLIAERRGDLEAALELFERAIEVDRADEAAIAGRDRVLELVTES